MASPNTPTLILDKLIHINDDGSFWLDQSLFRLLRRSAHDEREIRRAVRAAGAPAGQGTADPVPHGHGRLDPAGHRRSRVSKLARELKRITQSRNLCMAGGVALNCVANGKLVKEGVFDEIWIQPAAGDAGGAVGAALAAYHMLAGGARAATPGATA